MNIKQLVMAGAMSTLMGTAAFADGHAACGPDGQSIRILASDFPAIHAVAGTAERLDVFARIPHRRFPGGPLFRMPALVLAMAWYRLRDML